MSCIRPISVKDRNGKGVQIRCGKCRECMIRDCKDWSFRLKQELKYSYNAFFITLTYSNESTLFTGKLEISHVRTFLKNLRNKVDYQYHKTEKVPTIEKNRSNFRFFFVGEYGDKFGRAHYHGILFNIPTFKDIKNKAFNEKFEIQKMLNNVWNEGIIHIGEVNDKSINYICKYIFKQDGFRIMSKNPSLGKKYLTDRAIIWHQEDKRFYLTLDNGIKRALPEYYSRKIFDDFDRLIHKEKNQELFKPEDLTVEENIKLLREKVSIEKQNEYRFNKLRSRQ